MHRRSLALAASIATGAVIAGVALVRFVGRRYLRVAVAGESMTPALRPEDFLVLRAGPPRADEAFGQIVAVHDPRPGSEGRLLLKRVIGLPGDSLRVGGGTVQVNGAALDEPWANGETPFEQHRGINRLEPDQYFLLGDHRGASTDSRDFGPVRRSDIIGTVVFRYWPPERFGRLRPPARRLEASPSTETPLPAMQPLPWLERRTED